MQGKMIAQVKTGLAHLKDDGLYDTFKTLIHNAFIARGLVLMPNFFDDLEKQNIAYIILNSDNEKSPNGTVLALHDLPDGIVEHYGLEGYICLDKIAVDPDKWNNGILSSMIYLAQEIRFGEEQQQIPTLWRTSDMEISRKYERFSDFGSNPFVANGYSVHGFGFYDPNRQPNYEEPRALFNGIAQIVAAKPPTLIKLEHPIVTPRPNLAPWI